MISEGDSSYEKNVRKKFINYSIDFWSITSYESYTISYFLQKGSYDIIPVSTILSSQFIWFVSPWFHRS